MALFKDPLGQDVELGDIVVIADGGAASAGILHMVTRKGSTDLAQIDGSGYFPQRFLVKVDALLESLSQTRRREVEDLRNASREQGWLNANPVTKKAPSSRYLVVAFEEYGAETGIIPFNEPRRAVYIGTKYCIVKCEGNSDSQARTAVHAMQQELQSVLTDGRYLIHNTATWQPARSNYNDRDGFVFNSRCTYSRMSLKSLKERGLAEYAGREIPQDVIAPLIKTPICR